jgi:hypothetical protein
MPTCKLNPWNSRCQEKFVNMGVYNIGINIKSFSFRPTHRAASFPPRVRSGWGESPVRQFPEGHERSHAQRSGCGPGDGSGRTGFWSNSNKSCSIRTRSVNDPVNMRNNIGHALASG